MNQRCHRTPTAHPRGMSARSRRMVLMGASRRALFPDLSANDAARLGSSSSANRPDYSVVNRNLALELVRVTEAAALEGALEVGRGNKERADQGAVDAMRRVLRSLDIRGTVVIGEGEKDAAPMLFRGEKVGNPIQLGPELDVAVDPLDGTSLVASGRGGALAVMALAEKGTMFNPGPAMYMQKMAVGLRAAGSVSITKSTRDNILGVARALNKEVSEVVVIILDRPRHARLIEEVREAGARIRLIDDGDVEAAIAAADPDTDVDMLLGIGGTPEGVLAAAAIRSLGGVIEGLLYPRSVEEGRKIAAAGLDVTRVLKTEDLCGGEDVFFAATGVTSGNLLEGVRFVSDGAYSHSIVMRSKTGTVRKMTSHHVWNRPGITNISEH